MEHINLTEDEYNILINILVICSERGVFKINEFKIVGELFERIKTLNK